jgi:hypothetical protein
MKKRPVIVYHIVAFLANWLTALLLSFSPETALERDGGCCDVRSQQL